jgi:hypothetical protein
MVIETTKSFITYPEIVMEDPTDEVSTPLPAENSTVNSQRVNGIMRRIIGKKTVPWMTAEVVDRTTPPPPPQNGRRKSVRRKFADMLEYFNPFAPNHTSPPPQEEDTPAKKKPRLETPISTAADVVESVVVQKTNTFTTASPSAIVVVAPKKAVPVSFPIQSTEAPQAPRSRRSWTAEEDAKLTDAVKKHGSSWVAIATTIPGRNNKECRHRWANKLNPGTNQKMGKWTAEEDAKLIEGVQKHGKHWVLVAALVLSRTNNQCCHRWHDHVDPSKWRVEEDAKLTGAVQKHGKDWVTVAALVPGRNNVQCKQRWMDSMHLIINRTIGKWTPEEDVTLIDAINKNKHGDNWVAVAALVPGRTNIQCRQRWVGNLEPNTNRKMGKWTAAEDAKLVDAVKKHENNWVAVSYLVPNRTSFQCHERWTNCLDPAIDRAMGQWSKCGKDWVAVAPLVPGRTN